MSEATQQGVVCGRDVPEQKWEAHWTLQANAAPPPHPPLPPPAKLPPPPPPPPRPLAHSASCSPPPCHRPQQDILQTLGPRAGENSEKQKASHLIPHPAPKQAFVLLLLDVQIPPLSSNPRLLWQLPFLFRAPAPLRSRDLHTISLPPHPTPPKLSQSPSPMKLPRSALPAPRHLTSPGL